MSPSELNSYLHEQRENGFTGLSQQKRLFALRFIEACSYVEAAEAADITPETGRRWLRDPLVSCFINYLNQQKEHYSLIDAGFIETQYLRLFAKLTGEEAVPFVNREGIESQVKRFDGAGAVAALRDMAKISGHYKEDPKVKVEIGTVLSEEQKKMLDDMLESNY